MQQKIKSALFNQHYLLLGFIFVLSFSQLQGYAKEKQRVDALIQSYNQSKSKQVRFNLLLEIIEKSDSTDECVNQAVNYADTAIALAIESKNKSWLIAAFNAHQRVSLSKNKFDNIKKELQYKAHLQEESFEEMERQIAESNQKELSILEASQEKIYQTAVFFGIIIFVLTIISLLVVYKKYLIIKSQNLIIEKQKHVVEEKNLDITKSIEYALRIQSAILPPLKIVKQNIEDSFILYLPKAIVAGDFYWMEASNDTVLFAACDCTGHGIPGAMMTVVCHNALNRAVREYNLKQPAEILNKTAQIVANNFSSSEIDINDGMDISLCAFNFKTRVVEWAGANSPIWIVQNNQLTETKADKQPIGRFHDYKEFTNHKFSLNVGDSIYLITDGFSDQYGGERKKKLTRKKFKELILSYQHLSMIKQGEALNDFILNYKGDEDQIDDILVMGVKL